MLGKVSRIQGPIVDVDFDENLPIIKQQLETNIDINNENQVLILEVASMLGDARVRTIALGSNERLAIGQEVKVLIP